jgi:hypothetical protein
MTWRRIARLRHCNRELGDVFLCTLIPLLRTRQKGLPFEAAATAVGFACPADRGGGGFAKGLPPVVAGGGGGSVSLAKGGGSSHGARAAGGAIAVA